MTIKEIRLEGGRAEKQTVRGWEDVRERGVGERGRESERAERVNKCNGERIAGDEAFRMLSSFCESTGALIGNQCRKNLKPHWTA